MIASKMSRSKIKNKKYCTKLIKTWIIIKIYCWRYLLGTMLTDIPRESFIKVWDGILQRLLHIPTQLVSSKNLHKLFGYFAETIIKSYKEKQLHKNCSININ